MGTSIPDLSLQEKAAQLVFARLGSNLQPPRTAEEDAGRVAELLDHYAIGGVALFRGSLEETPRILTELQARSRYPLLVSTDMERGVGQQVRGATVFPHAMAFSVLGEEGEEMLEASARVAAREALACGIHITYAPVADVNRDPDNPIIGTRAFHTEADGAAQLMKAYIHGCQAEGLLTTAKHFPGHGNTHADSHAGMPVVDSSREELEEYDFVPFRASIDAGVDLMMTAHVAYPALDDDETPATLSRPILYDLLRDEMGFGGAVVTDSLIMEGVRYSHDEPGEQAVALLQAGVDILLDPTDAEAVIEGIVAGVEDGRLSRERVDDAFRRLWKLKQQMIDRFDEEIFHDPSHHFPLEEVGSDEHHRLARRIAFHAVTGVEEAEEEGVLPITMDEAADGGLLVVLMEQHEASEDAAVDGQQPLGAAIQKLFPGAQYEEVRADTDMETFERLEEDARNAHRVVLAPIVKPAAWQGQGLRPDQASFVRDVMAERPVILASLGSPYLLDDYPEAAARICTYSDTAASQQGLASALRGQPPDEAYTAE